MYDYQNVPCNICRSTQNFVANKKPLSNSSMLLSMAAPVQRVASLSEIAINQATFKARMRQVGGGAINYIAAMGDFTTLGFSIDIFQINPSSPPALSSPQNYFEDCIRVYYGDPQTGIDAIPDWLTLHPGTGLGSDVANYIPGNPGSLLGRSLAGTGFTPAVTVQLPALTAALEHALFPDVGPYRFSHWRRPPSAGDTFQYSNPNSIAPGSTRKSSQWGLKIANLMMERQDLNPPPVDLQVGPPGAAGRYGGRINNPGQPSDVLFYNPDTSANRTHTRTFPHELGHHLEANLGVEDMTRLYRGLYARTFSAPVVHHDPASLEWHHPHLPIPDQGIRRTGQRPNNTHYGLDLFLPPTGITPTPLPPFIAVGDTAQNALKNPSDDQSYRSQELAYPATVTTYTDTGHVYTTQPSYSTEFLSTTAEMMTRPRNARLLVETDPMRVALFLKVANPRIYAEVQHNFGGNLDALLHVD